MTINDLFDLCRSLAQSQGFYGRLLCNLNEMSEDDLHELDLQIQNANLQTSLDLILWLEG
jgi:hypothetical protein